MAIALVQAKNLDSTGTLTAAGPSWASATTAGNLLVLCISERAATAGTWPTVPSGYTAVANTPFIYNSTAGNPYGIFWKIAAGSDATPGNCGESSGTQNWSYTGLEFSNPGGWATSAIDQETHSAATATGTTSKNSGNTGTLAQASELVVGYLALTTAFASFTSFSGNPLTDVTVSSGATNFYRVGWIEVAATSAFGTGAFWTTSSIAGCRIATFKTGAPASLAPKPQVVRRVWSRS